MTSILHIQPQRSPEELLNFSSIGAGVDSKHILNRVERMRVLQSTSVSDLKNTSAANQTKSTPLVEQLLARLTSFKSMAAKVAMHLHPEWRLSLFRTLDQLMDPDDWGPDFAIPSEKSFSTFLRMIIYLHPTKRPGLGFAPNGNILAAWRKESDRIVIECGADDDVRWVLARTFDGRRESGAGRVPLHRVPDVTAPYEPETLFQNGENVVLT